MTGYVVLCSSLMSLNVGLYELHFPEYNVKNVPAHNAEELPVTEHLKIVVHLSMYAVILNIFVSLTDSLYVPN